MDTSFKRALTELAAGEFLRIHDGCGRVIAVFQGLVWITQQGDTRDVLVGKGQAFTLDRQGLSIVQALEKTKLVVFAADAQQEAPATARTAPRMSSFELHRLARRQRAKAMAAAARRIAAAAKLLFGRLRDARMRLVAVRQPRPW